MARCDRSVDVLVRNLRRKLEPMSPQWRHIHAHFGVGYRFAAEPVDGSGLGEPAGSPVSDPAGEAAADAPLPVAA